MYERISKEQKEVAKILKALSHPARVYIIEEISRNKICVCSLAKKLNLSFGGISRHFSILKSAGIVEEEKDGNNIYYKIKSKCIIELLKKAYESNSCIKN